jgi:phosphoribosylformylglycinamidine (FGAM) synthase-like enzyme
MPKDVDRYFKETKEQNPDYNDSQAWAVAWSRYCKYKNKDSKHCQKKRPSQYFPGQKKKKKTEEVIQELAVKFAETLEAAGFVK